MLLADVAHDGRLSGYEIQFHGNASSPDIAPSIAEITSDE
jgi:hypothetical protein